MIEKTYLCYFSYVCRRGAMIERLNERRLRQLNGWSGHPTQVSQALWSKQMGH